MQGQRSPFGFMLGRFIRFWGWNAWQNEMWPTTDGVVPFKVFVQMYHTIPHVEAHEIENASYAAALGYARAHSDGDNFKVQRALDSLRALANPQEENVGGSAK